MHFLVQVACAVAVVALAMRGVPRRVGALRAMVGIVAFVAVTLLWVRALWIVIPPLEPLFSALPSIYLKTLFAGLLYFVPPTVAALTTVWFMARGTRRARMTG